MALHLQPVLLNFASKTDTFLQEFIQPDIPWIHVDLMAYNLRSLPGRPEGGDAMGMRALFELIKQRVA